MSVTVKQVKEYNKSNVNWVKFFSVIDTIGSSMNGQKDRFDKSDIIEISLSTFSNGYIEYANDNGVDHRLTYLKDQNGNPTTQELKFLSNSFYGMVVVERKTKYKDAIKQVKKLNKSINLKLMNSNGNNIHTSLPVTYAKFLLVVDNYSVNVIETNSLIPYLKFNGDGILAKNVPYNLFEEVVNPTEVQNRSPKSVNYKEEKIKFQQNFLSQF